VLTPSVVRIDARGNVAVGARARRFLDSDPANTRAEFKRLMGTAHELEFPAAHLKRRPEQLSAEILKSLRNDLSDQLGFAPARAVISVPALFELPQTSATSEAARLAGFERIELIQEPVASAIAAGFSQESNDGAWLVYDLGGGTFDVSLLETQEGLLRVVGHDGDNFLGGRDFDGKLLDLLLEKLATRGIALDRQNPDHAVALRRLRVAAEDAKIELTRAREADVSIAGLTISGETFDVEELLTRAEYEARIVPLIDRTLAICARLLDAHGLGNGGLGRIVLVGGPTVTPTLRERVRSVLGVDFNAGLDPMTLVAQGAALFAGTVGLDGRPAAATTEPKGPQVWLQFPAMTSDLSPFVVGKLLEQNSSVVSVVIERADGGFTSEPSSVDAEGTFATLVNLLPRQNSKFTPRGVLADGTRIPLHPESFSITHGVTLGEPPLSRTVGVALADNRVQVYFERGSPLPIRRSFVLRTAETISAGGDGYALRVPIVQGEFTLSHLCRLVGTLEIPSSALKARLPAGSEVELTLELDRGGQLRATARISGVEGLFDRVALLVTPKLSLEAMSGLHAELVRRAGELSRAAFQRGASKSAGRLSQAMTTLEDAAQSLGAARGGDLDAGEQARRGLTEVDALLAEVEAAQAWPELEARIEQKTMIAQSWLAAYGTDAERGTLDKAEKAARRALVAHQAEEIERQIAIIRRLTDGAYFRDPDSWEREFEHCASRATELNDPRRGNELIAEGRAALRGGQRDRLERIVRELWRLSPVDRKDQAQSYGSGVRSR
jgi:molecular chaperone DnaK